MRAAPEDAADAPGRSHGLRELAGYFLFLGVTGFGGPVVLCGLMERDLVERRGWLAKDEMRDVIAVCQTMPGPLAVQVAIFIGRARCGIPGAWVAGCALILPASVMVGLLAAAYVHLHGLPWLAAVIHGVSPAVIALILQSWLRLVRLGLRDWFQYGVGAACLAGTLALPGLLTAMFLAAGLLGMGWYRVRARRSGDAARLHDVGSLALLAKLAWFFVVTGAFTFGGGLSVVPLLEKGLVGHWLSAGDFLTAIAVGMVTPGPVMTAATFAGYLVAGPLGAVVCTIAIYLPSFLLVLLAAPILMRHRTNASVQSFIKGVYGAAMGAILAAAILLGERAVTDWATASIAAGGLLALLRLRVGGPLLVGVAAAIGLIAHALHAT
jgi:chromate transporter